MNKKTIFSLKINYYCLQYGISKWQFGKQNAYLVVFAGMLYNDIFTLLKSFIFANDLCLYKHTFEIDEEFNLLYLTQEEIENFKFFNFKLNQEEYYIKYILPVLNSSNYLKFLQSALLYYLNYSIQNNKLSTFIDLFSAILYVNPPYSKKLYKNIKNLTIFSDFSLECLNGIFLYFTDSNISFRLVFKNTEEFLKTEQDHVIFRFLNFFSFYFLPKFRSICFKNCLETNSYIPMFLALKIYQLKLLNSQLTLTELKENSSILLFKESLINKNYMSKKNFDKLIQKNWNYK